MSKRIAMITLGCSKNTVDSEFIAATLVKNQYKVVFDKAENADIVVINTCSFINDAKEESIEEILKYIQFKKEKQIEKIYVIGCLAQRYYQDLCQEIPELDGIFGYSQMNEFYKKLKVDFKDNQVDRLLSTPSHYAYLKVSEGCDRACAYCAIPLIRGKHISKPEALLVQEAERLVQKGVKELILTAQDLTYYGLDLYGKRTIADLVDKLSRIKNLEWIRLHYAYPQNFPMDLLDLMKENSKICKYIDIPFQHIDNEILKAMKRGGTSEDSYNLIHYFRDAIPDIAIRTTLISGFPGETLQAHKALKEFVKKVRFDRLGVFPYSPEEGTSAYLLKDNVSQATKIKRMQEILSIQQEISLEKNQTLKGKIIKTIIDREEEEFYVGRTEYDSPEVDNEVLITKSQKLEVGNFYPIEITDVDYFDIFGVYKNHQ